MFAFAAPASAAAEQTRIIVKRDAGLSAGEQRDIREDAGVQLVETLRLPRTEVVAAPAGETIDALRELRADDDVVYAELDRKRTDVSTDDPGMEFLWALENHGQFIFDTGTPDADSDVIEAWNLEDEHLVKITGVGQTVAVVDSGVYSAHEDLGGQIVDQQNFVGVNGPGAPDGDGHGTHVSGTIAAVGDNGVGVVGVAPDAKIMALKALDDEGSGFDSDIAEAFRYAGEHNVRVVNASFGGPGASVTLQDAIGDYPNTLFVVAAGNSGTDNDTAPQFPCDVDEPNVLCVGASTNRDEPASYSNYGDHSVDVFAPGDAILSTVPPTDVDGTSYDYMYYFGTSMAAPHVAATAALVLQAAPALTAQQLKAVLLYTADDKAAFSVNSVSNGRLNAAVAVAYANSGNTPPDGDGDGVADAADACPSVVGTMSDGCPPDRDRDGVPDGPDNCDTRYNPNQADADRDGIGDVCDSTPRGPDVDGDGKPALDDRCPTKYAKTANGCPVVVLDRDGDGFLDTRDACPAEQGRDTINGCPLPAITALSTRVRRHRATITVRSSRAATVEITVQRKRGRRWVRVTRKTLATSANRVSLRTKRLRRGRYRAVVVLSSSAGRALAQTARFRVR